MSNYSESTFNQLKGKKIIIAGCNGYIGNELIKEFNKSDIKYIGVDKTETTNVNCYQFNLMDHGSVSDMILSEEPDYFFHLATHSALAYQNNLLEVFNEDNMALRNILVNLKKIKKTKLMYFSSSYVYSGHNGKKPVKEEAKLYPNHNFGMAKLWFENLIKREFDNSIIFRLSSVYGEGNYLHPNIIRNIADEAINDNIITIWGEGKRKMQYIYISDVIKHIISIPRIQPDVYNLCSNNYLPVQETAGIIAKLFKVKIVNIKEKSEGETLPYMDNRKIINELNENLFSDHLLSLKNYLETI